MHEFTACLHVKFQCSVDSPAYERMHIVDEDVVLLCATLRDNLNVSSLWMGDNLIGPSQNCPLISCLLALHAGASATYLDS